MTTNELGFNLLDEPWIVVLTPHGDEKQVSILELFDNAPQLVTIGGEVPTQTFAITRLLLAFLHRAIDGPDNGEEWADLWQQSELPMDRIHRYADRVRPRFDLFDPDAPFFQVPGLRSGKNEVSGLRKIVADVPDGSPYFTTRSAASLDVIEPSEAARWLVHVQAFDPSGIKTGAVGDPQAKGGKGYPIGTGWSGQLGGILPEGTNLRETLLLNLIGRDAESYVRVGGPRDVPPWERDVDGPQWDDNRPVAGAIDAYTWQTRRVRLAGDRRGVTGVVLANGDKIQPQNKHTVEPHTAWRYSEPQTKKAGIVTYMPRMHDPTRSTWRGLAAMLPSLAGRRSAGREPRSSLAPGVMQWISDLVRNGDLPASYVVRTRVIGAEYGLKSTSVAEIVNDTLTMAAVLVSEESVELGATVQGAIGDAEGAASALWKLADQIARAAGAEPKSGAGDGPREALYSALEEPYRRWLSELTPGTDATQARNAWQGTVRAACRPVVDQVIQAASPAAWRGRTIDNRVYNVAVAEARFRAELRRILPGSFGQPPTDHAAGEKGLSVGEEK